MKRIERAVLSVSDKEGLAPFASALASGGTEILSTGGTARLLREEGVPVREVRELTGFPEMMGGRVRTLHPALFGGILARRRLESDRAEMREHRIEPIDLVVVNFYPFEERAARPDTPEEEIIESIDIGGPSLLRAAAKSFEDVAVLHSPAQYRPFLDKLASAEGIDSSFRRSLAREAFRYVTRYDEAILSWFGRSEGKGFPDEHLLLAARRRRPLRYGENPHQSAAWYDRADSPWRFEASQGKELSYNNLADADAAWLLALEFDRPAAVIVKHGNPCGAAEAASLPDAFRSAHACDPLSAFGGIIAVNRPLTEEIALELKPLFLEVVAAPAFDEKARALLAKKKKLRLLEVRPAAETGRGWELRILSDGLLVQENDPAGPAGEEWRVATERAPADSEWSDLRFAWSVAKHVRSNAIVLAREGRTIGIGAGQMSRVDSTLLAMDKAKRAGHSLEGAVLASDGFFPFPDSVERAGGEGIGAFVQPGGSIRDAEVIAEANRRGISMVLTGVRHFRH